MVEEKVGNFFGKRHPFLVFMVFFSVYLLTYKGISTGDNIFHYEVARNFVQTGNLSIPTGKYSLAQKDGLRPFIVSGRNNRVFLALPQGLSIASIPLVFLGNIIENRLDLNEVNKIVSVEWPRYNTETWFSYLRKLPTVFFAGLINPLATALLTTIFYMFSLKLSGSRVTAILYSLLLGLGTILWPYSSTYWTQPLTSFCSFTALYYLYCYSIEFKLRYIVIAGLFSGYAFITRFDTLVIIPWFIIYMMVTCKTMKQRVISATVFLSILMVFTGLQANWNYYRFGSIFKTGSIYDGDLGTVFQTSLFKSLPANLLSMSNSIFLYSPPLLLAFFGLKIFWKFDRKLYIIITVIILTNLVMYSKFVLWAAISSWGPRFLVPVTPFILLLATLIPLDNKRMKYLVYILLVMGFLVQLPAVVVPYQFTQVLAVWGSNSNYVNYFWNPELTIHFKVLFTGFAEFWWLDTGIKFLIGMVLFATLVGSCINLRIKLKHENRL